MKSMKKITLIRTVPNKSQDLYKQVTESIADDFEMVEPSQAYNFAFPGISEIFDVATVTLPIIPAVRLERSTQHLQEVKLPGPNAESQIALLRKFVASSGIYGLAAAASPLISLFLTPFLAHNLTATDYGVLAIINTAIGLVAGITQLGFPSAFFRAYNYDYSTEKDHNGVIAAVTSILGFVSVPVMVVIALFAPQLAAILLGNSKYALEVSLAGVVVLLQNLTVPGLAWQRAANRPLFYSLLSMSNLLGTLLATLLLVGVLNGGVAGAIIANGLGYACIVVCTLPIIFARKGIKVRLDIARSLLGFGCPLILNFVSYWILQLSDRYLLSFLTSLEQAARYTVAYTLGSVMSALVIGPFTLVWPTAMFTIAKREDALEIFRLIFRWFGCFLIFAAFGFSLAGTFLLDYLFPSTYHSASHVIPIVSLSTAFYGIYYIFALGINIKRKTWLISVYTSAAAIFNIALNLVLIPHYGITGAAISTFLAYVMLTTLAYAVNQKIYPIHFEIGLFSLALALGVVFYMGSAFLISSVRAEKGLTVGISLLALCSYGGCLMLFLKPPLYKMKKAILRKTGEI